MKYALIIIDGAADDPIPELGGKTPLEAAGLPAMDRLARRGALGLAYNCPPELPCGSDVAIMSVMGYDPAVYYTGRASLEAAAQDIELGPDDWVYRTNIVTVRDGVMKDHSADNIPQPDADKIIALLNQELAGPDFRFYPGVSYRNLLVVRRPLAAAVTTPPHDILDQPVSPHLPQGGPAPFLLDLMAKAGALLARHRVNPAADGIWFWGQGKKPRLESFRKRFGISAAAVTAVDLVRGLAKLSGWELIAVPGATAYFDTNYRGKGEHAARALASHDLVCVHVEAPDEAGHKGDAREKIKALENIDRWIVGPLLEKLAGYGEWRLLLLPDHPTPCAKRTHTHDPVPFVYASSAEPPADPSDGAGQERTYGERQAAAAGLVVEHGHTLMEKFIRGVF